MRRILNGLFLNKAGIGAAPQKEKHMTEKQLEKKIADSGRTLLFSNEI